MSELTAHGFLIQVFWIAGELGRLLWQRLFGFASTDAAVARGTCIAGGALYRLRVRLWQALAVLSAFAGPQDAVGIAGTILELLKVHSSSVVQISDVKAFCLACSLDGFCYGWSGWMILP